MNILLKNRDIVDIAKYKCNICGEELWTRNSNGQELCFTEDGKRHYKSKCNLNGGNSTE